MTYATGLNARVFPPQLFDIDGGDLWEMHNIADKHPDVVQSMDKVLRSEINYPSVMRDYEAQGKDWAHRWMASYSVDEWHALLRVAYKGFDEGDMAKFVNWIRTG